MKFIITFLFALIFSLAVGQDSINTNQWNFFNEYGISKYISLIDGKKDRWWGHELEVNIITYQSNRHQIAISSGMFFINRKARQNGNPNMQYFYFPIHLSYKLFSKNKKLYGEFSLGRPLLLYEDSKYYNNLNFWLHYEEAFHGSNPYRKKIHAIHSLKFGYCIGKHFALNVGETSYHFSSDQSSFITFPVINVGFEYKL